jgi:simple sugar transport system ATP-binding protein
MRTLPAMVVRGVSKAFGATRANSHVSLEIAPGEIVALVGENGAGKSTLLSILAGFLRPDSGALDVGGRQVSFARPADSMAAGIGLVHQHLSLVPMFTVREQLELAGWKGRELPPLLKVDFNGSERVEQLPLGKRQRLEIAKCMIGNPSVLLLDEPTSILAPVEVDELFAVLRELRDSGIAVVIVTHKLREAMAIADRVVAMAAGRVTGEFARTSDGWRPGVEEEILAAMFSWQPMPDSGTGLTGTSVDVHVAATRPILRVMDMSTEPQEGTQRLRDINLELRPGTMYGIAGVDGQGQTELAELIAGYRKGEGSIALDGRDIAWEPAVERTKLGVGLLVDDRLGEAAVASLAIAENLALKRPRPATLQRGGFFRRSALKTNAERAIDEWHVQPADPWARFGDLSGGNMQRILAARELERNPRLLVALNPVQGLDTRTSALLWARFRDLCAKGGAVLFFTTDLEEAIADGDQVAVMFDGGISVFEPAATADPRSLGSMMVNGW